MDWDYSLSFFFTGSSFRDEQTPVDRNDTSCDRANTNIGGPCVGRGESGVGAHC